MAHPDMIYNFDALKLIFLAAVATFSAIQLVSSSERLSSNILIEERHSCKVSPRLFPPCSSLGSIVP